MSSSLKESRDENDECSTEDTHAELLGELNKSVSRLRALSTAEFGDNSVTHLEHTLDAILNMAQKTTFDESTSLDSLRVARPVQKRKQPKAKESSRLCGLRLLLCGKSERRDDDYTSVYPDFTSLQSRLASRSKESFWKEGRSIETAENRQKSRLQEVAKDDCNDSSAYSVHSKKDLVVRVGRKHEDDISSLSSDLFARRTHAYDTNPVVVSRTSSGNPCFANYDDLMTCRTPHRQLPMDEAHFSFLDLLTCRGPSSRRERLTDVTEDVAGDDHEMKILGVGKKGGESASIRSDSLSTARTSESLDHRKMQSKISRVEAEHTPKQVLDQTRSERATIYIYNQGRKSKR